MSTPFRVEHASRADVAGIFDHGDGARIGDHARNQSEALVGPRDDDDLFRAAAYATRGREMLRNHVAQH